MKRPASEPYRLDDPVFFERFIDKVYEEPNSGCWLWGGALRNGYGVISVGGRPKQGSTIPVEYAHRLMFWHAHGEIPDGHEIRHRCDVRACCNPAHLTSGTRAENVDDMHRRGRYRRAKRLLSRSAFERGRAMQRAGASNRSIARELGISAHTVPVSLRDGRERFGHE